MPGLTVVNTGNRGGVALASAARTATTSSDWIENTGCRGVLVVLDVTAGSSLSLTLSIQAYDPASGKAVTLATATTAVTGVSTNSYLLYAGSNAGLTVTLGVLPNVFRISVTHTNANSATYSVGYSLIP
jgi:hypothetical protein